MPRVSLSPLAAALLEDWRLSARDALPSAIEQLALAHTLDELERCGTRSAIETIEGMLTQRPLAIIAAVLSLREPGAAEPEHPSLQFLPPHVNLSGAGYRTEATLEASLRRPLGFGIRLTPAAIRRIVRAQPFESLDDLLHRAALTPAHALTLARGGALDGLPGAPGEAAPRTRPAAPAPSLPLFVEGEGMMSSSYRGPQLVERVLARLASADANEVLATGSTDDPDPLSEHRPMLSELEITPLAELAGLRDGQSVRVAGRKVGRSTQSRQGETSAVSLVLDDGSGQCTILLRDERAQAYAAQLSSARTLLFDGVLANDDCTEDEAEIVTVTAHGAWSLAEMTLRWRASAHAAAG